MYINPMAVGILSTLFVEMAIYIAWEKISKWM